MRIVSERLVVRPFVPEDVTEEYLGWLNDRELMRFSQQRHSTHTFASCLAYLASFELPDVLWSVECDGAQVGTLTTYVSGDSADVGVLIGRVGRRYGSEAFGAALAYLFEVQGVEKVTAGTMKENVAMIRIAGRWGMRVAVSSDDYYRFVLSRDQSRALDLSGYAIREE